MGARTGARKGARTGAGTGTDAGTLVGMTTGAGVGMATGALTGGATGVGGAATIVNVIDNGVPATTVPVALDEYGVAVTVCVAIPRIEQAENVRPLLLQKAYGAPLSVR
jgi:hypothetical protein